MKPFTSEDQRYQYDLNVDSVVMDIGGYHGDFSAEIARRYGCRIFCFEPIAEHCQIILGRNIPRLTLFQCAVGGWRRFIELGVSENGTGFMAQTEVRREVWAASIMDAIAITPGDPDLIKINIEGMEYDLLECLIAPQARNIQVQFHLNVPDAEARRAAIIDYISKTHECEWCSPFIWESWKRK